MGLPDGAWVDSLPSALGRVLGKKTNSVWRFGLALVLSAAIMPPQGSS